MNFADITALSTSNNPRLILAEDLAAYCAIQAGDDGSSAVVLGNAQVPTDASILPPQSYVDNIEAFTQHNRNLVVNDSSCTYISGDLVSAWAVIEATFAPATIDLSGCALSSDAVNEILHSLSLVADIAFTLDLSGGTNAAPSGQGVTDAGVLTDAGWTVTTN